MNYFSLYTSVSSFSCIYGNSCFKYEYSAL